MDPAATEPDVVIAVRNVRKSFRDAEGLDVAVLSDVSFDVHRGETLVIMGGSGCGKSTLLNCLIGEYPISGGRIEYRTSTMDAFADIATLPDADLDRLRLQFGILFQSGALFNSMTVAENVALPLREHSAVDPHVIDIVVTLKLEQVRMLAHRQKFPSQLSGGQKKRAGLARATALDPEILFYDEPSAGLDPVTSSAIDELMRDLSRKLQVTSVVVTHHMDSALKIADRLVMLDKGRVIKAGPRAEFERIMTAPPDALHDENERLIHQFMNGRVEGPLTNDLGISEFEKLLVAG